MTDHTAFDLEVLCDTLSERTLLFKELVILAFLVLVGFVRYLTVGWAVALCFGLLPPTVRAQEPTEAHGSALALMAEGRSEEARRVLETMSPAARAASPHLGLILGVLRREAGDLSGALAAFEASMPSATGHELAKLWAEQAVTHSWLGALDPAEKGYRASLVADPGFRPATVGLARILRWQGRRTEAEALYAALLSDGGEPVEAMIGMGLIAIEELDGEAARSWLQKALDRDPGNAEAMAGLARLHEAKRWRLRWSLSGSDRGEPGSALRVAVAAAYKVLPGSMLNASLDLAPHSTDVVGSDPNAVAEGFVSSSATLGWMQRLTRRWTGSLSVQRLTSPVGFGHLGTVEAGGWLAGSWSAQAGVRAGNVPSIGAEVLGWAGLTRSWPSGRSLSATLFQGSGFGGASSRSVTASAAEAVLGDRVPVRAAVTRGWTTSGGFWQGTLRAGFQVSADREVTAEVSRFSGVYRVTTFRVGARLGF